MFDSAAYYAVCKMIYSLKSSEEGHGGVEYSNHSYTPNVSVWILEHRIIVEML